MRSAGLKIARGALKASEALRAPHIDDATTVFDDEEDPVFINTPEHVAFGVYITSHIVIVTEPHLMVADILALHPFNGLGAVTLIAAGAKDDVNAGLEEDVTKAHYRVSCFVIAHSPKKSIPVLRLRTDVMLASGNIGEGSVYIEDHDLVRHFRRLARIDAAKLYYVLLIRRIVLGYCLRVAGFGFLVRTVVFFAVRIRYLASMLAICVAATSSAGQSGAAFKQMLQEKAGFSQEELSRLAGDKPIVKLLPTNDRREVEVIGVIRLRSAADVDMAAFRESLSQRSNEMVLEGGVFSSPPVARDLEYLEVNKKDLEDLKKCIVGNCKVKLSVEMIRHIGAGSNMTADQRAAMYKDLLIEYVRAYWEKGDKALIEYADQRRPVNLANIYPDLLTRTFFISTLAPEFEEYLRTFPASSLSGVEDRLEWSNVSSGLKPIFTITHGSTYFKTTFNASYLLQATKQVYASHYIDASLALSALVTLANLEGKESYLVFANISHSDSLGGALGRLAQPMVEREAVEKVTDLLLRSASRLEAGSASNVSLGPDVSASEGWAGTLARYQLLLAGLVFVIIAAALIYFRRRLA